MGRLTDVTANLDFSRSVTIGGWAPAALRSVRRLHIATGGNVHVTASLLPLISLEELSIEGGGDYVCFLHAARLPPSVTKLHLEGLSDECLPPQVLLLLARLAAAGGCYRLHRQLAETGMHADVGRMWLQEQVVLFACVP